MKKLALALVLSGTLVACAPDPPYIDSGINFVVDEKFRKKAKIGKENLEYMRRYPYGPITTSCTWSTWGTYEYGGSSMTCY